MAIAFAQVKYLSRSKALQATAAAAYRSCSKIYDERTGLTFDYTNKKSPLLYSEIILPKNIDPKFKDREYLWNKAEQAETRTNSQVAKEIILALPKNDSISDTNKIELARHFAINHFVNKGVAVDINIHNEPNNPHAHILVTTRRLMDNQFDSHKARDLDPKVHRGKVQADKVWADEWRHFQNNYFLTQGLDLVVDADGIISQVHLGKQIYHSKDKAHLDLWKINETYKNEAKYIALTNPQSVLNQLTLHHAVFTEHDIAKLLHKHINDHQEFQSALIKVKTSKQLISLGIGDNGKEQFTTKEMFELENKLQVVADILDKQHSHLVDKKWVQHYVDYFKLNAEQANAIRHITNAKEIAIIVGRAGTGKTYTLKAAKEIFEKAGYNVQGIALSGIAAQGLKESSNIPSRTISSFNYAIRKGTMVLNKQDVIILDEAGMVDNYSLAEVLDTVHKAQAKIILVGDPDQLQPIGPGAPFRALLEQVGFAELHTIIRQVEEWQREATHHFATGKVKDALTLYHEKGNVHIDDSATCMQRLIKDWHEQYHQNDLNFSQILILTHRNQDVMQLNQKARAKRILAGEISQGIMINKNGREFYLSEGDRLLFLKNDPNLDVKNGQFGTVTAIELNQTGINKIIVNLDSQKQVTFDPHTYPHFTHGYSATIHKAQGVTVDHSFVYVAKTHWSRHLIYVAASRHRKTLDLYADRESHANINALIKDMEKVRVKDSVLDYPLYFAERRGIDIETLVNHLRQHVLARIKQFKTYLQNKYELFLSKKEKMMKDSYDKKIKPSQKERSSLTKTETINRDNLTHIQVNFQTLLDKLNEAKKANNPYRSYQTTKELQREINHIQKNKILYQAIQIQMPELGKVIERYQTKHVEYEQDL